MLGNNPIRKQEIDSGDELWIQEVFYTLQGEGPFSGEPAVFVRMAGCNLKCYWCDTDFESSNWHPTIDKLFSEVRRLAPVFCDLVVITGGEPFRQNIRPFIDKLLECNFRVQIETNGTLWVDLPEDDRITIVCSPKTGKLNKIIKEKINAYKYVIGFDNINPNNGLPNKSTQVHGKDENIYVTDNKSLIYVMPRDDRDNFLNLKNSEACVESSKYHGYKLCLQIHKVLRLP